MDKADRLGEYGHWLYKSVRASIKWARELGARWKQQLFDPAPASAYCGFPADDYRVDQERARIYNTNFIMRLEAGQETPKDIETVFATGIPAILRPGKEDPLYNLVAFRSFEDELTRPHSIEVYTLSYSEAAGRIVAVPYKKGQARCNIIKERAPNRSLIIIKEDPVAGRALNDADLAKIISSPPTLPSQICASYETSLNMLCSSTPTNEKITLNPSTKKTLLRNMLHCFTIVNFSTPTD